jgi:hypothetical protein
LNGSDGLLVSLVAGLADLLNTHGRSWKFGSVRRGRGVLRAGREAYGEGREDYTEANSEQSLHGRWTTVGSIGAEWELGIRG